MVSYVACIWVPTSHRSPRADVIVPGTKAVRNGGDDEQVKHVPGFRSSFRRVDNRPD
jgi:hypothetical protein